ncbi:MAG: molecular chaperone protein containing DnaJ domain [Alphaproteobacteria bacterium]|jgi:molecular chaperone HscB|nr:molecular chaperone protein containing DnaJ domain [Alphaproteobacteria bacterium]MDF3033802.1 molecular chaperone protein containing DnaJ domain [Alphaproteobacteria bacterium]
MFRETFDPFALLGMEPTFEVDLTALDEAYFARQALAHPDRFVHHSEPERQAAAAHSSSLNQAYEVLKNPTFRAKSLLRLRGIEVVGEEGKVVQDSEVLEEMMGLREALAEADTPQHFSLLESQVHDRLEKLTTSFSRALRQNQDQELPGLFLRLMYLSKLEEDIKARQQQSSLKVL